MMRNVNLISKMLNLLNQMLVCKLELIGFTCNINHPICYCSNKQFESRLLSGTEINFEITKKVTSTKSFVFKKIEVTGVLQNDPLS